MSPRARPGSPLALLVVAALAVPALALAEATPDLLRYFTAEEIAEREAFSFPLRMNWLVSQLLNVAATVAFLGFGLNRRLRLASEGWAARLASKVPAEGPLARIGAALSRLWGDGTWSGALLFGFAYFAILQLMALPQSFYFDWVYQRAHGLSVEPFGRWLKDMVKGQLTGVLAFSFLVFGLYGLVRKLKRWPLVLGIPCAVLLLGAGILDPYRTRFYFDYVPMPKGEAEEKIRAVLAKAGVEYEGVYVLKMHDVSRRVNASLEGEGPTRRIVVWDTTLATLTPDEVANAVAHEVGHLNDRGIGKPVMAGLAVIPLLLGLSWFLRRLGRSGRFGFDGERDVAGLPAAMFFIWLLITVASPVSATFSRASETRADQYALELLKQPEEFRSLMVKLAKVNMANLQPPWWTSTLLASHPKVIDRIAHAERFARENGLALQPPSPELFRVPMLSAAPKPQAVSAPAE